MSFSGIVLVWLGATYQIGGKGSQTITQFGTIMQGIDYGQQLPDGFQPTM